MAIILDCFNSLTDPRREHRKQHKLSDIIFITIAAVICGADDWYEIEEYGKHKQDWLKTILELPYGIPSHSLPRFRGHVQPCVFNFRPGSCAKVFYELGTINRDHIRRTDY